MIKRIHHIGIAVSNLEEMIGFYRDTLGVEVASSVSWPGLEAAIMPVGDVLIELIQPVDKPQIRVAESLCKLVEERGGGVHHFCLEVDDIDAEVKSLQEKGVELIDEIPRQTDGGKIAWLHENAVEGIMLELCEEGYEIT